MRKYRQNRRPGRARPINPVVSFVFTGIALIGGLLLLVLFYQAPHDLGIFPQIDATGRVSGAAIRRFIPDPLETVQVRAARPDGFADEAQLVTKKDSRGTLLRVVRDNTVVVFEEQIDSLYSDLIWDSGAENFVVSENRMGTKTKFLQPEESYYRLLE